MLWGFFFSVWARLWISDCCMKCQVPNLSVPGTDQTEPGLLYCMQTAVLPPLLVIVHSTPFFLLSGPVCTALTVHVQMSEYLYHISRVQNGLVQVISTRLLTHLLNPTTGVKDVDKWAEYYAPVFEHVPLRYKCWWAPECEYSKTSQMWPVTFPSYNMVGSWGGFGGVQHYLLHAEQLIRKCRLTGW